LGVILERRLVTLLLVLGLIAVPAMALRAFCVGNSCESAAQRSDPVPFCSLDPRVRDLVTAGFYEGRSPEALGVTGSTPVVTAAGGGLGVPWPSAQVPRGDAAKVPLLFLGPGFRTTELSDDLGLDQIAPTLEPLLGLERPFPEVRSGRGIDDLVVPGARTPLAVVIVWKGVGMPEIRETSTPWFDGVSSVPGSTSQPPDGFAGGLAEPGSLPYDPAAVLATIGSGGLPSDHGVTGTVLRAEHGVARAFGRGAPSPVIAALGDDLDDTTGGRARIGLLATDVSDRGLIGGTWYGNEDDDLVVPAGRTPAARVDRLLDDGWGADATPDVLGIVLRGSVSAMDRTTRGIVEAVQARIPDAAMVVTATGSLETTSDTVDAGETLTPAIDAAIATETPIILSAGAGGLFPDEAVARDAGVSTQQVADAMRAQTAPGGTGPLFADTFPSFTVRFGRYC
jgi:hypothetical protein